MRSFMRLKQRRNVDLPQPDGPMNAVTRLVDVHRDVVENVVLPVAEIQLARLDGGRRRCSGGRRRGLLHVGAKPYRTRAFVGHGRFFSVS
jgi:hypothetical protein